MLLSRDRAALESDPEVSNGAPRSAAAGESTGQRAYLESWAGGDELNHIIAALECIARVQRVAYLRCRQHHEKQPPRCHDLQDHRGHHAP